MLHNKDKERRFKPIKLPAKTVLNAEFFKKEEADRSRLPDSRNQSKAHAPAGEEKKLKTRDLLCNELLREGFIQSYIDMFYLSSRTLPNVIATRSTPFDASSELEDLTESDINFLNELSVSLKRAEASTSYNSTEKEKGLLGYSKLAETYELQGDNVTAAYFYNRIIDMSKAYNKKQFEVSAMVGIGKCYEQERQTDNAIGIFEDALAKTSELTQAPIREDLVNKISKDLIEIYMKVAQQFERAQQHENALIYFEKCLQVARSSGEKQSEGKICYRIGELYYKGENFQKSVEFHEKYLNIIKGSEEKKAGDESKERNDIGNKTKRMEAHASLAKCYLKMKWIEQTEQHLNEYNQLAKDLKIQNALADSSFYLAKLNEEKGNHQRSIDYYKSYFQAAKAQKPDRKDRHLIDKARVMYSIAKTNQLMDKYIGVFNADNSLKDVLDWKIKKELK